MATRKAVKGRKAVAVKTKPKAVAAKAKAPVRKAKAPARKPVARKAVSRKTSPGTQVLKLAGIGSDAVLKATGKAWSDWLKILDKAGADGMRHKEIAEMVYGKFGVPGWWSQMVTVGYEQARGLRAVHEKVSGFSASVTKTFQANMDRLYNAWHDPRLREVWLPGAPMQVRRSTDGKSMRVTWTLGNSNVDVNFTSKGPEKSTVQVEHSKLSDAEAVAAQKAYWNAGLERLGAWLGNARPQ
ncbi:hypothetical protein BWI17_13520 [Betaproteobacteria bacterium GR16-43]|nr:hypothetical protein BWI17_13520 [Betaproteobacteria bacterium GR16-43]